MFSLAIFRAVPQLTERLEEANETNGSTELNLHLGVLRKNVNSELVIRLQMKVTPILPSNFFSQEWLS